ncbi:beta-secretase 2-like [Sycon ciliatum]|uniref:beta-secretase 2-like n=1 Tax=Sycon ciliatum TaxID=27933 RepID=UPI0031F6C45A
MDSVLRIVVAVCMGALLTTTADSTVFVEKLNGYPGQGYAVDIALGTPGQKVRAIVDTGSSNFAIAGAPNVNISHYFDRLQSSSVQCEARQAKADYQFGSWQGTICQDVVQFGTTDLSTYAFVTLIDRSSNFYIRNATWQGILGLAYDSLALPDKSVIPVLDNLVSNHKFENSFTMSLCGRVGTSKNLSFTGSLTLGSNVEAVKKPSLVYTKIVEENFYSILIDDMQVGGMSLGMDCKQYNKPRTFVDSGTTFLSLPTDVFLAVVGRIQQHLKKSNHSFLTCAKADKFWTGTSRCAVTDEAAFFALFPSVTLSLTAEEDALDYFDLTIPPHLYLQGVPCFQNPGHTCFMFSIQESAEGPCILGTVLMEGYDVVFDRQNRRIGFSASSCTVGASHLAKPSITGLFRRTDATHCKYSEHTRPSKPSAFKSTILFFGGVAFILMFVLCSWDNCFNSRSPARRFRRSIDVSRDSVSQVFQPILSSDDDDEPDVNILPMEDITHRRKEAV